MHITSVCCGVTSSGVIPCDVEVGFVGWVVVVTTPRILIRLVEVFISQVNLLQVMFNGIPHNTTNRHKPTLPEGFHP